jgi:hypothetical protein
MKVNAHPQKGMGLTGNSGWRRKEEKRKGKEGVMR